MHPELGIPVGIELVPMTIDWHYCSPAYGLKFATHINHEVHKYYFSFFFFFF